MSALRVTYELADVSMTGWYDQFFGEMPDREVLAEVFGERGIGYMLLVGAKVESVAYDANDPPGSSVDARLSDGRVARGPARLVVRRSVEALMEQISASGPSMTDGSADSLRAFLGPRFLLVAAMHGFELLRLVYGGRDDATLHVLGDDGEFEVALSDARAMLAEAIVEDLQGLEAVSIDEPMLVEVRALAAAGEAARVVGRLEPVVGPIVSALRSGTAANMNAPERARLVEVVELLAKAYADQGDATAAETVLRLGAQGCRGEPESAPLFVLLGELALARDEPGEAVGLLMRARQLGAAHALFSAPLAEALLGRGRAVAALGVVERARMRGVRDDARLDVVRARVERALAEPLVAARGEDAYPF